MVLANMSVSSLNDRKGGDLAVPSSQREVLAGSEEVNGDPLIPRENEREARRLGKR